MKLIIAHEDGSVDIIHPNPAIYGDEPGKKPFESEKALQGHIAEGREWFMCSAEDIPDKTQLETREQLYHDNGVVKADLDWQHQLMPVALIKKKHLAKLKNTLPYIDYLEEVDRCNSWTDKDWYQQAETNLGEKVANGEADKPKIKAKLTSKINSL